MFDAKDVRYALEILSTEINQINDDLERNEFDDETRGDIQASRDALIRVSYDLASQLPEWHALQAELDALTDDVPEHITQSILDNIELVLHGVNLSRITNRDAFFAQK